MEKAILSDPALFPADEVISSHLGANWELWQGWQQRTHDAHPGCEGIWRYYNDGKSWLFRFTLKKKTLCWASLHSGGFRITCYFTEKALPFIENSTLPETLKESFRSGRSYGRIRGITVTVATASDVDDALSLTAIRSRMS